MYKKNIKLDYLHTFFRNFNLANGVWMVYLNIILGFNYLQIAIFEVIFHISSLVFEIPTGVIADVFGRKVSRILGIILYLAYIILIITTDDFFLIVLAFVLCGISYTLESGAAEALVYDSMVEENIESEFMAVNGKKEVIMQSAAFAALMLSGKLAEVSYEYVFMATGAFFILGLISILFMKEVKIEREKKSLKELLKDQFITSTKIVFKNKRLFLLIIIGAMMLAPITTIFFFIQNRLYELEFSIAMITVILGFHALFAAIGGFYSQKLERKFGEKKILFFIPLFIVICFWFLNTGTYMIIPFIILGFFDSVFYVVLSDYVNKMVESKIRATVLSFFGMAFSFVMIFIFLIVGYVGHYVSLQSAFIVLGLIVTGFYILLLPILKGSKEIS